MSKVVKLRAVGLGQLASDKVISSGIMPQDAEMLGMYSVDNAAVLDPSFDAVPALVLPYYGADRKPLKGHSAWPDFYRVRYLSESSKSFSDVTDGKKQRYSQPPGSGVCAYLPLCVDWAKLMLDPTEPILITEGELKAAKASLQGFPTVGLGGVYNFRATSRGMFFLPELEAFKWPRRRVTIVYDSDYVEKPDICHAINALAEELQERGAIVNVATLPELEEGKKTGLDDFLLARPEEEFINVLKAAEPLAMSIALWRMNEQVVYVQDPGIIVVQDTAQKLPPAHFTAHSEWATKSVPERKVTNKGTVSLEKVSASQVWLRWPLRRAVRKVTYQPGQPRFTDDNCWNQWEGWGCEPVKGDITPWKELIRFIFEGAEPAFVEWFLDWCAWPLQHPGAKMFSAVVMYGSATGTGKTLIGYTLGKIYGANFTKIENKHLRRDFNGWAENRQFVLGDEISGSDKRSEADAMKTVITQEELSINIKMLPEYTIPDCINYYFTSNHADAFFIEDADRRYGVHEVLQDAPLPDEFYANYEKWKNGSGPSHLFHYLLQRDLSNFNPKAAAYKTAARKRMSLLGKSDLGAWCAELVDNADEMLRFGQMRHVRDLFTSQELLAMYQAHAGEPGAKVTANGMARALAASGFRQVNFGNPVLIAGKQARYFAIRNTAFWRKCRNAKDIIRNASIGLK